MRVSAEFIRTDDVEVTLTITMPLRDWKALRESVSDKWPGFDLKNSIDDAVNKLERRVTSTIPTSDELPPRTRTP